MSHEKETKPIHTSTADLLHIRKGSLDWSAREGLAIQLLWASAGLLVTCVSFIYLVDEFFFLFPGVVKRSRVAG